MTDAQRAKAEALRRRHGVRNVTFVKGYIDAAPFEDGSFDVVISNGVINLAVDKPQVFARSPACCAPGSPGDRRHRHRRGPTRDDLLQHHAMGRLHRRRLAGRTLQAGDQRCRAARRGRQVNDQYRFLSDNAQGATKKFGVKSVSLRADKA